MRIAGSVLGIEPEEISKAAEYLASEDTSNWPSILDPEPSPTKTDVKYDPEMDLYAPQIPVETADAGKILREYGNALLSPILGEGSAPFGKTDLFGGKTMMESATDSVNKINERNRKTEEAMKMLLGR